MKKKYCTILSIFLSALLLLSACSGKSMSVDADFSYSENTSESFNEGWNSEKVDMEMESDTKYESEITESENLSENDLANRKLIKTLYLTLETKEFDRLKSMLNEVITAYGGYIQESNFYAPQYEGRHRSYSLTVRIPADNLDAFHDKVGLLGTVTNESEKLDDVTTTYVDLQAYKESLDVEYDKILELLEKATDLDQILLLESKLSELRYEINAYESKLRTYDNLISYSTIHIDIREVSVETVTDDSITSRIRVGFMSSLYSVCDFFVDLLVFILSNLPTIIVIAIAIWIFRFIWKKTRKQTPKEKKPLFKFKKVKQDNLEN